MFRPAVIHAHQLTSKPTALAHFASADRLGIRSHGAPRDVWLEDRLGKGRLAKGALKSLSLGCRQSFSLNSLVIDFTLRAQKPHRSTHWQAPNAVALFSVYLMPRKAAHNCFFSAMLPSRSLIPGITIIAAFYCSSKGCAVKVSGN